MPTLSPESPGISKDSFQNLLKATGLELEFNSIPEDHRMALLGSFEHLKQITQANDFVSQLELLKKIINNDAQASRKPISGEQGARSASSRN